MRKTSQQLSVGVALRRWSQRHRWTAPALIAFGYTTALAGAAIGGMNSRVAKSGVPLLILGLVMTLAGITWIAVVAWRNRAWAIETTTGVIKEFHRVPGPGQLPRPGDVDQVIDHATRKIDPAFFYNTEQLRGYLEVNPGALRVLRNDRAAPTRLTGYYILLGLSERAEGLIQEGAIDVGSAIVPSLTVHDPGTVAALYLGMIQGFGRQGSAGAVLAVVDHVKGIILERGGSEVRVYARAGTDAGRHLMNELGFKPLLHPGGIEAVTVPNEAIAAIEEDRRRRVVGAAREN